MSVRRQCTFSQSRLEALSELALIASGRGWCNVAPCTVDDVSDTTVTFSGMWVRAGVPVATLVTATDRNGVAQPSSLGVLHSRRRLGIEFVTTLLGEVPFTLRQDHNHRGLVLEIPCSVSNEAVLEAMCTLTTALCDYDTTGWWRMDVYVRE